MSRTDSLFIFAVTISLLVVQCAPAQTVPAANKIGNKSAVVIGYGAPGLDSAQIAIMNGLIGHAEEKGWSVITANANRDKQIQAGQIAYFISQKVDVIVVVPEDSQGVCESVQKAREAGTLFYTIDRAPIGCEINMTVLANNYGAGVQAGEAMVKLLTERYGKPQGTVLELQGNLSQNVAQLRGRGFHMVIDQHPDIRVISKPTEWQSHRFASATQEVVASMPVDGIYMHSDSVGTPVVLPILDQLGKKVPRDQKGHIFIVGVDGSPEALQAIRDGYIDQASSQPLPDYGIIADWIEKELSGEAIQAGQVVEEGALWSPATVERGETGWQLLLATTSVTVDNVDDPRLWGNQ